MKAKQRLLLAVDETWQGAEECHWVLCDAHGKILQSGIDSAEGWPAADECALLLLGAQATWIEVRIPAAAHREEAALVGDQLESQVLDIDVQHRVRTHRVVDADPRLNRVGTLLVERHRLIELVELFRQLARPLVAVWAEVQTAGLSRRLPALLVGENSLLVRPSDYEGFAVDRDCPAQMLSQWLPPGSHIYGPAGEGDDPAWSDAAGSILVAAGDYCWWESLDDSRACNLLQGEFATAQPAQSNSFDSWRRPAAWALGLTILWLVLGWGEVMFQRFQLARQRAEVASTFASAMPGSPMISPVIQLLRKLTEEQTRRGLLRDDDFFNLLDAVSPMLPDGGLQSMVFAEGRLSLQLPPEFSAEAWRSSLAERGLEIQSVETEPNRWSIGVGGRP